MENSVKIDAPCKLNFHLAVTGIRDDGFHSIESLFQAVSLEDALTVTETAVSGECTVRCPALELPERNTVSQAVALFREETGIYSGVRILLEKRIPAGAGLGGGSSDGAAALKALNGLFSAGLSLPRIAEMAAKIGSDVPFFVHGGAALVSGRGETVRPIGPRTDLYGVLIWPGAHSSTPRAYGLVDAWKAAGAADPALGLTLGELEAEYRSPPRQWRFANSFTVPVSGSLGKIAAALADIKGAGADFAEMSGSGSAVFGIFDDSDKARRARAKLAEKWEVCVNFLLLAS